MEHRIGRAVGVVLDIVRAAARELVTRVEAGDLNLPGKPEGFDRCIGHVEKIVVVEKVGESAGMDE